MFFFSAVGAVAVAVDEKTAGTVWEFLWLFRPHLLLAWHQVSELAVWLCCMSEIVSSSD